MRTVKVKLFEVGTDKFIRKMDFIGDPVMVLELLSKFTIGEKNWASFAISEDDTEKGGGVVYDVESIIDTFKSCSGNE